MGHSKNQMAKEKHPREALAECLEQLANGARYPEPPLPQAPRKGLTLAPPAMDLPPLLVEEVARLIFDFWEREAARANPKQKIIRWDQLGLRYQTKWTEITRIGLEMFTTVMLSDIHRFLRASNGDMGEAFASALRRYARTVLNYELTQSPRDTDETLT